MKTSTIIVDKKELESTLRRDVEAARIGFETGEVGPKVWEQALRRFSDFVLNGRVPDGTFYRPTT